MHRPMCKLYVHFVWATWDRLPLIDAQIEAPVYGAIAAKCRELRCTPLAIGGVADHVHVLVQLAPVVPVSRLVQEMKGASSHLVTHEYPREGQFRWQGSYAAFSVGEKDMPKVRQYIEHQKQHHADGSLWAVAELEMGQQGGAAG